jgi:hypothetical protein
MSALSSLVARSHVLLPLLNQADRHLHQFVEVYPRVANQVIDIDHHHPEEVDMVAVEAEKMMSMFRTTLIRDPDRHHRGDGSGPIAIHGLLRGHLPVDEVHQ